MQVIIEKKLAPFTRKEDFDIVISDFFDFLAGQCRPAPVCTLACAPPAPLSDHSHMSTAQVHQPAGT